MSTTALGTEPTILRKSYSQPYVLDRGKLSRMLTIVEQRLTEAAVPYSAGFEVTLKNEKKLLLRSAQDLFALDNSVKNPIRVLRISIPHAEQDDAPVSGGSVTVRFDSDRESNISIGVRSLSVKVATELFAELEEQVDRTIVTNWILKYIKSGRIFMMMALVLAVFAPIGFSMVTARSNRPLSSADTAELEKLLTSAQTEVDKIDALVQVKIRELNTSRPRASLLSVDWATMLSLRGAFIALPLVVLIVTLLYMVIACYPWAVFAWGDYEQHYKSLVGRRKTLGAVIVGALVIGIMANLFVASVPPIR